YPDQDEGRPEAPAASLHPGRDRAGHSARDLKQARTGTRAPRVGRPDRAAPVDGDSPLRNAAVVGHLVHIPAQLHGLPGAALAELRPYFVRAPAIARRGTLELDRMLFAPTRERFFHAPHIVAQPRRIE